jgi:hypothetical protein
VSSAVSSWARLDRPIEAMQVDLTRIDAGRRVGTSNPFCCDLLTRLIVGLAAACGGQGGLSRAAFAAVFKSKRGHAWLHG